MAYILESVRLHGDCRIPGLAQTGELWHDIQAGRIPLLYDSRRRFQEGLSPVMKYSDYEDEDRASCAITIFTVHPEFFRELDTRAEAGEYRKYVSEAENADMPAAAEDAWSRVHEDVLTGKIVRAFGEDFESDVPARYTPDNMARSYLYISIQPQDQEPEK